MEQGDQLNGGVRTKRCDGAPGRPGSGTPRLMSKASKPAKQSGTRFADTIRASGREKGRINRPDTRLHPTKRQNIKSPLATREPSTQDIGRISHFDPLFSIRIPY